MDLELVFEEKVSRYPNLILWEEREQEETVDLIIPDSFPDGVGILQAYGTPLIYAMETTNEAAAVSGEVQGGVLYQGAEGEIRSVKARVPFAFRRELKENAENLRLFCTCRLLSADARLLNSRKILLRMTVQCSIRVYGEKECRSFDVSEPAPTLQLKRTELPLRLPFSLGEKRFSLQEELPIPRELPEAAQLMRISYDPLVIEQKAVGDKAVFKGELHVNALWEDEEEQLFCHSWALPFSQYVTMECQIEDCDLATELSLLSADTQPDQQEGGRLLTAVELCAQTMATGVVKHVLIEDAFCTDGTLQPSLVEQQLTACLDQQEFRETVELQTEVQAASVLCASAYPAKLFRRREGDQMLLEQGLCCDVLYYDGEKNLCSCRLKGTLLLTIPLMENVNCRVQRLLCMEPYCALSAGVLKVKLPVELWLESTAEHQLQAVSGGEVLPAEDTGRKPSLLLRFTEEAESLWDIAKSCKTSTAAIRQSNDLVGDTVPANTLLLIPM